MKEEKLLYFEILEELKNSREWARKKDIAFSQEEVTESIKDIPTVCCIYEAIWAFKNNLTDI